MKPIPLLLLATILSMGACFANVGEFSNAEDIGNPKNKGSSSYDEKEQAYTLKGGGYNIWFAHDEFHFLYKKIKGDFLLTANFELVGNEKGNGHRKTGWMIRETADHDAVSINTCAHGDGLVVLQWRAKKGENMRDPEQEIFFPKSYLGETIMELERIGKKVTMRIAHPGEPFEEMGSMSLPDLQDEVLVGPYVLAHDPEGMQEARVWNVRISTPVAPDWNPNKQIKPISHASLTFGNKLETLEIATGKRKVIQESEGKISAAMFPKTAPEPEGQNIYYADNKTGTSQIWKKKADGSAPQQITFDLDHAWFPHLSPDGKWLVYLAYPHDANPKTPGSYQRVTLKLMPAAGGAPKTIAYVFGGKEALAGPCWVDNSKIVFVSNSEKK
jgi:TolB protein